MKVLIQSSLIALAAALTSCGNAAEDGTTDEASSATVISAEATFDTVSGAYKLAWTLDDASAPVDVLVSASPDGRDAVLLAEDVTDAGFTWTPEDGVQARRYFIVEPTGGEAELFATRLLPLEGGRNFRDLGGYMTTDGQEVKWGRVFRSGVMDGLTDADYDYLSDLGIKVVCDFRESDERAREATDWRAGDIEYLSFSDPVDAGDPRDNPMFAALMAPDSTPEDVAASFADAYFDLAMNEREGYTVMFDQLAAGQIPLAFNCSAGKDRAGTAAALILTALSVPRETVVHDYSLSDDYVDYMAEFAGEEARAQAAADPDSPYAFLMQLPPEKLAPLMASDPRYIEASFAEMEARYGSVMGFIQTELDVTDEELLAIRSYLLN